MLKYALRGFPDDPEIRRRKHKISETQLMKTDISIAGSADPGENRSIRHRFCGWMRHDDRSVYAFHSHPLS